jgi:hypothetical protein
MAGLADTVPGVAVPARNKLGYTGSDQGEHGGDKG